VWPPNRLHILCPCLILSLPHFYIKNNIQDHYFQKSKLELSFRVSNTRS
jgi:hypothetical protein